MDRMEERLLKEYFGKDEKKMEEARKRLENHEPLAYILGETVFYDEFYTVNPSVLIPRPDTERVVEILLQNLQEGDRFIDLCTGSGCIAISTLCHSRNTKAIMVDFSKDALETAKINVKRNHVEERATLFQMDLLKDFPKTEEKLDVLVSNPPYVVRNIIPTLEEECHKEPYMAFDGGEDGGDFYRRFMEMGPTILKEQGKMIFEIGYDQGEFIRKLGEKYGYSVKVYKDYSKNDRVAVIQL